MEALEARLKNADTWSDSPDAKTAKSNNNKENRMKRKTVQKPTKTKQNFFFFTAFWRAVANKVEPRVDHDNYSSHTGPSASHTHRYTLRPGDAARMNLARSAEDLDASFHGLTLLQSAVRAENVLGVGILLQRGASLSARDDAGNTALHHAALTGAEQACSLLLEKIKGYSKIKKYFIFVFQCLTTKHNQSHQGGPGVDRCPERPRRNAVHLRHPNPESSNHATLAFESLRRARGYLSIKKKKFFLKKC